jgi:hypothetical protein
MSAPRDLPPASGPRFLSLGTTTWDPRFSEMEFHYRPWPFQLLSQSDSSTAPAPPPSEMASPLPHCTTAALHRRGPATRRSQCFEKNISPAVPHALQFIVFYGPHKLSSPSRSNNTSPSFHGLGAKRPNRFVPDSALRSDLISPGLVSASFLSGRKPSSCSSQSRPHPLRTRDRGSQTLASVRPFRPTRFSGTDFIFLRYSGEFVRSERRCRGGAGAGPSMSGTSPATSGRGRWRISSTRSGVFCCCYFAC